MSWPLEPSRWTAHVSRSSRQRRPPMHAVEGLAALDLLKALAGNPDLIQRPEGGRQFELVSEYQPAGDQPQAIAELVAGLEGRERDQVLLGVTGSGKTFTMAQVIAAMQRPAIVLA